MSSEGSLNTELSKKTSFLGLKLWVLIGISVGAFIVLILCILSVWVSFRRKSRKSLDKFSLTQIPNVSKDIKVDRIVGQNFNDHPESVFLSVHDKSSDKNSEKMHVHLGMSKSSDPDNISQCSSVHHHERACSSQSGEEGSSGAGHKHSSLSYGGLVTASPLIGLPEISHLGWGHWFTLRDLEIATNRFSAENVLGEGGYGVVYKGRLINGSEVAVKKLLNNLLAYLHEAIEPKVVHRDIKSSNILIDDEFNAKVSDFGLAKLLDSGESHITTRVMGTFGYVAPEYANTGMLNEKSDIYSFGVLLLEVVTGRDPVDYGRPANEVNLVEWLKMMVGTRRAEEVVDPNLEVKPATRALKRSLLVALRCVDPDSEKRPKMSQVVRMLEADDYPFREEQEEPHNKYGN
ncbi:protein kinase domain-containing protein [Citrus sinensis]|nr:protein kinase domain-containing protein [Citrus sinensis]